MLSIDFNQLRRNLLLTQAYCYQQLAKTDKHPASILRSINPEYNGKNIFEFEPYYYGTDNQYYHDTKWGIAPYWDNIDLIEELYYIQLAHKQKMIALEANKPAGKGDILVFCMDETLIDGAAAAESEGFLDSYNCPPIDTWFFLAADPKGNRLLLAWVPDSYIEGVSIGIAVNPESCIGWFRNWCPAEYEQLIHSLTKPE